MKVKNSNRSFGLLFSIVFLAISVWPLTKGENILIFLMLLSLIFLILGLLNSKLLSPLNKAWVKLGEVLGIIIAPIIMALVYFIVLTPVSLTVRLFGKDLLGLKFSERQGTYWIKRKKNLGPMKKQF